MNQKSSTYFLEALEEHTLGIDGALPVNLPLQEELGGDKYISRQQRLREK